MIESWKTFLQSQGARVENGAVQDFGHSQAELAATKNGTILADLSQLGLIAFSGEETVAFLQGQLTNDVRELDTHTAQWNGYCSPKGRLLGNFLMWRQGDDYLLQMSGDIRKSVQKKLAMFIMRSKTKARDASDENIRLVIAGPQALDAVQSALGAQPDAQMQSLQTDSGYVIRVGADKFVLSLIPAAAEQVWKTLAHSATPVGAPVWDGLRLNAGIPMITAATQDEFVPQMVNLEVIGGVSFQKGCYTGQEIVARSQYLGKLKRRMYLAHVDGEAIPGDSLYSADADGQATGMVVNAAPAAEGGCDLLAVMRIESAKSDTMHLKNLDGPTLTLKNLPYTLPE
ncbi:MAG: CAF17-like 4Fe-4S cluster assembly/insertion protein YgfZ [Thiobacillus sp.]